MASLTPFLPQLEGLWTTKETARQGHEEVPQADEDSSGSRGQDGRGAPRGVGEVALLGLQDRIEYGKAHDHSLSSPW